jgi:hypothetical protein
MRRFKALAALTAGLMLLGSAALAADLLVDATLSADSDLEQRTEVSVGESSFDIKLWATGNLPSGGVNPNTGAATVVTEYRMATDGTITPGTETKTVNFKTGFHYTNACTAEPATAEKGCVANPFVIPATLTVDEGTPSGTFGTVVISPTGSSGLETPTPIQRYVVVVGDEPLEFIGFFSPVDMEAINVVKAGRTVPLKFQVKDGDEFVSDVEVVESITASKVACPGTSVTFEPIADSATSTGKTELRYDFSAEQFVYNWQTPKNGSGCYDVTVMLSDGTEGVAQFQLR